MGSWYWVGVAAGVGAAVGLVSVALVGAAAWRAVAATILGGAAGLGIGFVLGGWPEAVGGAVGGVLGAFGAVPTLRGALERGGTRVATGALVVAAAVTVAVLSFVPLLGYVLAGVLPVAGLRARRRSPERYAGLRTLAR